MKIALTHVDLPNETRGGVAHQVHYLANALVEHGHDVTMFTFSPAFAECQYQVHTFPSRPQHRRLWPFAFGFRLARTDFSAYDVLHVNGNGWLVGSRYPMVRTFWGTAQDEARSATNWKRRLYQRLTARLEDREVRLAAVAVGISEATRQRLPRISVLVPCGVDMSQFYPGPKTEHPTIFFVGTTGGRKRGRLLLEHFLQEVHPRFPTAELRVVAEAPMEGEQVVFYGKIPTETLAERYRQSWVFCLPSSYEGFGVPYLEALASGTAVVATPNPGAKEVLQDGKFGLLATETELGAALCRLLEDVSLREQLAHQGPERAQEFSWENVVRRYEAVYAGVKGRQ